MPQGTIKTIVADRGFGFIKNAGSNKDLFFHISGLARGVDWDGIKPGDRVDFELEDSDKGPRATNVRLAQ